MEDRILEERRKDQLATLLTVIIQNSTIVPFRWHKNKYMCFYCRSLFVQSAQLKEHTDFVHKEINMKDFITRTLYRARRTKLDVSNLWCTCCDCQFIEFQEYLDHLTETHEIAIDKEITQCFDCFHLADNGMSCLECGQFYQFFGPLLLHTYKYHIEQLLCEICGQGYVGRHSVHNHVRQVHGIKSCKHCNKIFQTQYALTNHVEKVHRTDKLQCTMCPAILGNSYLKKRHMALVHDCKNAQFVCEFCSKIFTRNSKCVQHKLRVHLKEKNCTCEICGHKAFNIESLKRHLVCHDEVRNFKCETCQMSFRRKKTLVMHMRTHRTMETVIDIERLIVEVSE